VNHESTDLSPLLPDDSTIDARGRAIATAACDADIRASRSPRTGRALAVGVLAVATVAAVIVLLAGSSSSPTPAYGAELVHFAESTPLLLLKDPDWRVADVVESRSGPGMPVGGQMYFQTGSPASLRVRLSREDAESHTVPAAVRGKRQSEVELSWRSRKQVGLVWSHGRVGTSIYSPYLKKKVTIFEPGKAFRTTIPGLEVTAYVDPRAENTPNQTGPGNRHMVAIWTEGDKLLALRSWVPSLAAFEERLSWLAKVDAETWLDAMPAKVVKAADHRAVVREMLDGIPVPASFTTSRIPGADLTTNRYQLGAAVAGTVSCLWLRQWAEARSKADRAAAAQAESAMATSKHWPILREMSSEGAYPDVLWEIAAAMRGGHWVWAGKQHLLLPHAEGLGCARLGLPVLPWKQRRQRERATASS
jgi:hypothetical protein